MKKQKFKNFIDSINPAKIYGKGVSTKTDHYQKKYKFKDNPLGTKNRFWNNEGDAFKHAYMQADLSFKFGDTIANIPGYFHEAQNLLQHNPVKETNMDLWNNKVGRKIGLDVAKEMRAKHKLGEKKNWQEIDDEIAKKIMEKMRAGKLITTPDDPRQFKYFKNDGYPTNLRKLINQPNKDFSKLEPAKLDELKQAPVQGVDETIITYPAPTVNANPLAWLGQFGNILSLTGNALGAVGGIAAGMGTMGATKSVSAMIVGQHHTGGKVSGRDEVLAILRGGETVRTEAQEMELQEERYQQFASAVAPYIENPNRKPKSIAEAYDPDNKIPCLLNKTTQDEELIIGIIAKAWKSNRLGFRNILRYE